MKLLLSIILILMLTACDGKKLTDLQEQVSKLETLVTDVTKQHDTLKQKFANLQTLLETLNTETQQTQTP